MIATYLQLSSKINGVLKREDTEQVSKGSR